MAEGRDITTVVAPDADVRVLLIASEEARLARRARELHGEADDEAVDATRDQVVRRDRDDSTVSQFMQAAPRRRHGRHLRAGLRAVGAGGARRGRRAGRARAGPDRPGPAAQAGRGTTESARQWTLIPHHLPPAEGPLP